MAGYESKFIDERILCRHSIGEWYNIIRAVHENVECDVETDDGFSHECSSGISNAGVEGTKGHMIQLARAILAGKHFEERRCAVSQPKKFKGETTVTLWSPRNSNWRAKVPLSRAITLAKQILEDLND